MKALLIAAVVVIAFRIFEHYWVLSLLDGYMVTAFAPIVLLLSAAAAFRFMQRSRQPAVRSVEGLWITLLAYVAVATIALVLYEPTVDSLLMWLAYVWSPVLVFGSVLWLPTFNVDKAIHDTLKSLVLVGFLLSLYAAYSFAGGGAAAGVSTTLQTNQGEREYYTTYVAGFGGAESTRWTVPGLNTSHFGPMLLPLVFISLLLAKQSVGAARTGYRLAAAVITVTIVGTLSRGAMIPLIFGLTYLACVGWYRRLGALTIGTMVILLLAAQPVMLGRILITIGAVLPLERVFGTLAGDTALSDAVDGSQTDAHFLSVPYTISMILEKPVLGHGWTNFIEDQRFENADAGGKDHNNYLSIAAGFGLPALTLYVGFLVGLAAGLRKVVKDHAEGTEGWQMAHVWAAILLAYALYLIGAPAEFHFLWIWYGLMAAWIRNRLCAQASALRRAPQIAFRPTTWNTIGGVQYRARSFALPRSRAATSQPRKSAIERRPTQQP